MADQTSDKAPRAGDDPDEAVADSSRINPATAAALLGGTVAAAAGAYFGTRALARKNREKDGRPLNSVMAAAITACDLAHTKESREPPTAT